MADSLGTPTPENATRLGATAQASASLRLEKLVSKLPVPPATRTLIVANQKGGCGKSTTVINLASCLAASGARVLVVDLDSQCNSTQGLGIEPDELDGSIFDVLTRPKETGLEDVIVETEYPRLHLAPASRELATFECRVAHELGRESRLKKALARVSHLYDYIFIDTPPSLGLLTVNALAAGSEVLVPLQPHPFAFDGLELLLNSTQTARQELNPTLALSGILVTMFDARKKILREIVELTQARKEFSELLFTRVIRQNTKLTESSDARKPILYYAPESNGAEDYMALTRELVHRFETARTQSAQQFEAMRNRILALNKLSKEKGVAHPGV